MEKEYIDKVVGAALWLFFLASVHRFRATCDHLSSEDIRIRLYTGAEVVKKEITIQFTVKRVHG